MFSVLAWIRTTLIAPVLSTITSDRPETRACVLRLAFRERTTSELARELGTSAATVSGHTKPLRAAGLIVTTRAGTAVLHSVTAPGDKLLQGAGGRGLSPPDSGHASR